ncbi:hypothetical protein FG385_18785 [Amycolatopsis alkalitolerans]|uniref:Uncharacterized protein n=1 Tax=Amycolatopsis alkalitolerans TaxID=2547244 RepID=A0A5C4LYQ0_9PSEU|nr:hypothetical protein FG385_18785 [Amycolatopsis alkalitolerans]
MANHRTTPAAAQAPALTTRLRPVFRIPQPHNHDEATPAGPAETAPKGTVRTMTKSVGPAGLEPVATAILAPSGEVQSDYIGRWRLLFGDGCRVSADSGCAPERTPGEIRRPLRYGCSSRRRIAYPLRGLRGEVEGVDVG